MNTKNTKNEALEKAINSLGCTQSEFARMLTDYFRSHGSGRAISQQQVWNWINKNHKTPADVAYPIEVITNSAVKAFELCPGGVFPKPEKAA